MHILTMMIALLVSVSAQAQHAGHHNHSPAAPYAGMQQRQIKALSNEQIADLRAGRGMATALAAELNGYPGPMHVLEFADKLGLTDAQRQTMEALVSTMRRDAVKAGEELIMAEAELDKLFASGQADDTSLIDRMQKVSLAQGQVRLVHLRTHLSSRFALTPHQIATYAQLRGYKAH